MLYAMLTGLDAVDPACYPPNFFAQVGGREGVSDLGDALTEFYDATVSKPAARAGAYRAELIRLAGVVKPGDVFVNAYAGHGLFMRTTIPPARRFANEGVGALANTYNWTTSLVLEDRLILADELNRLIAQFAAGVQVVNIVDACCSGTTLAEFISSARFMTARSAPSSVAPSVDPNQDPSVIAVYEKDRPYYDSVLAKGPGTVTASCLQFASTPANEQDCASSLDAPFTDAIATAIRFNDVTSYADLFSYVKSYAEGNFNPFMTEFGASTPDFTERPLFDPCRRIKGPDARP
jgi:hypothetical protein